MTHPNKAAVVVAALQGARGAAEGAHRLVQRETREKPYRPILYSMIRGKTRATRRKIEKAMLAGTLDPERAFELTEALSPQSIEEAYYAKQTKRS